MTSSLYSSSALARIIWLRALHGEKLETLITVRYTPNGSPHVIINSHTYVAKKHTADRSRHGSPCVILNRRTYVADHNTRIAVTFCV